MTAPAPGQARAREERPGVPASTCQYCLADGRYTPIASTDTPAEGRCPVCGAAYTGPRRTDEYRALMEAGLVNTAGD